MVSLRDAYVVGQNNFEQWSQGFDTQGYLKVLPRPDEKVLFRDPFQDWQNDVPGNYFSSWGAEEELVATLNLSNLTQIKIDGFGTLQAGDGLMPWFNNASTPYEFIRGYNGTLPGPMLITEPGDTLKIQLVNDLNQPTNFHTHGLHVSPLGHGDNVLFALAPGETWEVEIEIPDDHFIGTDWYHPHLHGLTNEQVASGLGGLLIVNPRHDLPDLEKWNPKERPMYFMSIQSFGIQQIDRPGAVDDPLNQNLDISLPAGTPLAVLGETPAGDKIYEMSDALFVGFNAKPIAYDPSQPIGNPQQFLQPYGGGGLAEPVENVIHTINGQYNPTIETETGQWELFSFANMSVNSFHVIQLVKEEGNQLVPQEVTLVAIDGDASGVVESIRRNITELPLLNPGSRVSFQQYFQEPGVYHFLSNGTESLLGENTSVLIGGGSGFNDGHLIWGSQVLATVEVTGDSVPADTFPEVYDSLIAQSEKISGLVEAAKNGDFERERTFVWDANIGSAIARGNIPDDLDVTTFEGTYTINGEFFSTDGTSMTPLTMPMLGTTEIWNIQNRSGKGNEDLAAIGLDIPLLEWHPFHIHQNDFIVLEINGLPVDEIQQNYLAGVLSDTIGLPPSYAPGSVTLENPYGTPLYGGTTSEVKILMEFDDFPGSYVMHCHILFHEDAGMMAVVRVILNTDDTWMGTSSQAGNPDIQLFRGSSFADNIRLTPYGSDFMGGIEIAIADVNFLQDFTNHNVTDNVTDIVTVQSTRDQPEEDFQVKIFDGKTLFNKLDSSQRFFDGHDQEILISEFNPFQGVDITGAEKASVATADMNGDGHADIIVGVSGNTKPLIEVYSGKDFELLGRINPFHHNDDFNGTMYLAGGDVDGDNFEDLIVSFAGGIELYSGISLDRLLLNGEDTLDGVHTAHETALLDEAFRPYGESYTGEIEVTSGYILQTPVQPNGKRVQTNNANITTMAIDSLPEGEHTVKVHTFLGGHNAHHNQEEATITAQEDHADHGEEEVNTTSEVNLPLRLDASFTPNQDITTLSGTFADIYEGNRGTPVLIGQTADGSHELISLQQENTPETFSITNAPQAPQPQELVFGSTRNDSFNAANPEDSFEGNNNILFTGSGSDFVDASTGLGHNRIYTGSGNNEVLAKSNNRVFGGDGSDTLTAKGDNNRLYGGAGDDELEVIDNGSNNRLFGGEGNNTFELTLSGVNNRAYGGEGNNSFFLGSGDSVFGGEGNDSFFVTNGGNNSITGGAGINKFWVVSSELPEASNTITDFDIGKDIIGIGGFTQDQLSFRANTSGNAILTVAGSDVATFLGLSENNLQNANFTFA